MNRPTPPPPPEPPDDSDPRLPGFRTWRGVYWFVLVCCLVVVAALAIFSRVFA